MTTQGEPFELPQSITSGTPTETQNSEPLSSADGGAEGESQEQEPIGYEEWLTQQFEANPHLKAEHETRGATREKEIGVEQYRKFQSAIQPAIDHWSQNSASTKQAISQIAQTLQKAVGDGTLEADEVANLITSNQSALDAFNQQQWWEGTHYLLGTLGTLTENESLANEFIGRLFGMAKGKVDPDFGADLLKAVTDPIVAAAVREAENAAYERGVKAGKKVTTEEGRAATRANTGPDLSNKATSGTVNRDVKSASLDDLFSMEQARLSRLRR